MSSDSLFPSSIASEAGYRAEEKREETLNTSIKQVLKKYFGYSEFKPGQEAIINNTLQGSESLGIIPTGGGKSLCYQIPALLLPGVSVVVSPLIALMKDQVDALNNLGVPATYISSALTPQEINRRLRQASQGEYKLIYVAPERLTSEYFSRLAQTITISSIAIDEAHCVSQWGHDFRPSYAAIAPWIESMPYRPVISAFTATASDRVREDIIRLLSLQNPSIHLIGFDRPNLHYTVIKGSDRKKFLEQYLKTHSDQSGIIYAATRKEVDSIYSHIQSWGIAVGRYHAGLSNEERNGSQEAFLYDEIRVMVASNAFGLGIDKSNIRYVIHHNMPRNLESYYQEAGRAGRDGEKGDCILLYSPADIQTQKFLIEQTTSSEQRKEEEYRKMQTMIDYCHTTHCLRQSILEYFGEKDLPENCGNCTNCTQDYEQVDMTIEAQKIFSCIVRMKQQYGIKLVASVLKGSQNKRIRELRLDQLSTYGIMREMTLAAISDLINILAAEDYIYTTTGQYPVVKLKQKAVPVLKSQAQVILRMPSRSQATQEDSQLFQALCALRQQIARKEQVPPYVIFHDLTLREMSAHLPTDDYSMLAISGVGEIKMQKYGQLFMELIQTFASKNQPSGPVPDSDIQNRNMPDSDLPDRPDSNIPEPEKEPKQPSHMISWDLYQAGNTIPEIAKQRKIKVLTVQDHILRCAREGLELNWPEIISEEEEACILKAIQKVGTEKLKPIKEALPEQISYFAIKAAICRIELANPTTPGDTVSDRV